MFAFDVLENTRTTFFKILKKTQIPEKPLKNWLKMLKKTYQNIIVNR